MKDDRQGGALGAHEPIAIVGMSCNLPGGNRTPEAFFDFLLKRKCGVVEIPEDRWNIGVFHDPNSNGIAKSVSKWGGFVDGLRAFDAKFFGISPREAAAMDPQQRMVLQGAVEAMMDAQIPLEEFSQQSTGVFIGISQSEYRTLQEMRITSNESYAGTGYALCITANRVSHRLNLSGPSCAIDTACSSSLTALNQAVHNLRGGACDMAIVGGVNALTHPSSFLAFSKAGMISPTGRISTFDASANGFVRGEGVGTVVIKTLSRAQMDGDRIHAVIRATRTNQDGATNTITAPNQEAQIGMLRRLFDDVDVSPDQIGFVEAHGTGTPIGDPIEAGAIGTVIGQNSPDHPIYVGSSKANVGHLESGAGITGLIKAAMAVKMGIVPPNIHFRNPNPQIPFDALNLEVPVAPTAFPETGGSRFAVVNSFGFGGANACALLESPPESTHDHHPISTRAAPRIEIGEEGFPHFFPLSGATQEALQANAAALLKALGAKGALAATPLEDISAALATRRSHLMFRAVILARSDRELKTALRRLAAGKTEADNIVTGQKQAKGRICFTFSGQGSQWWGMARDLLENSATFSKAVREFDAEFAPVAGWSIREELLRDKSTTRIDDTTVTQPALFAIQSGLAALWKRLGVEPDMVAGHSIGEAAASYVAGGLSLSGAAKFLSKRGTIRDRLDRKGAMAAIGLNHADVEPLLPEDGSLGIAAINGPGSTTISGDFDALHAFVEEFRMAHPSTFIRALNVDTAWHSHHLDAGEAWFRQEMTDIDWSVPTRPFISTVTGRPETRFDTDYGWLNLRRPVRFQAAVETALRLGATRFVELGPAATLAGPTRSTLLEAGSDARVFNSINRKENDFDVMARTAAALFVEGYPLKWTAITGKPRTHVALPPNVWITEEFWQDSEESRDLLFQPAYHPFLGFQDRRNDLSWGSEITLKAYPYLKDHRMQAEALFPAAGYLDTMIALCRQHFGPDKTIELENAVIHEALFISEDHDVLFRTCYDPERSRIRFYSRLRDIETSWTLRSECTARVTDVPPPGGRTLDHTSPGFTRIPLDFVYCPDLSANFVNYGSAFQTIEDLWMSPDKTVARLVQRDTDFSTRDLHHLHPTLLDGCLQLLDPNLTLERFEKDQRVGEQVTLPVGCGRIRVYGDFPKEVIVEADQFSGTDNDSASVGFTVFDPDGTVLATVTDMRVKFLPGHKASEDSEDVPAHFVRQNILEVQSPPAPEVEKGKWVVLDSDCGVASTLIAELEGYGATVQTYGRAMLGDSPGDTLADLLGDEIEAGQIAGILVAWPLAVPVVGEDTGTDALFAPLNACVTDLISLGELMDFARGGTERLPDFVFLTSGAYPDEAAQARDAGLLTQMPLATLVRGLSTETPEYRVRVLDADRDALADPERVAGHILTPTDETELILRGGKTLAPRLAQVEADHFEPNRLRITSKDRETNFHATMRTPGVIDQVELAEIPLAPVGPGEVRVRVSAVGLNFRDVMAVTGLLPKEAEPDPAWQNLGLEFGGIIETVGEGVTQFAPGDRVMGLGRHCLQRFMTTDARALTRVPDHISLAEAATIPSAFATAHYALNHVGRMRAGEKVFIHVATGGVGTAAVQLAQAAGAEIFATAGSPEKRALLRELGITHVMDSRTLKFADDVMEITGGTGVDILLNSLPGAYIAKGLDIMAPYGRFLEIGKRDVYEDTSIGMKALRRNVSLNVLDLAAMGLERPDLMAGLFDELSDMLTDRMLTPLPLTEFPISRISDAIRYMSQARHVGKVVVSLEEDVFEVRRDENRPVMLSPRASYLVTGGTSGFSLSVADWLSRAGAGHLVLASRSGRIAVEDEDRVRKMRDRGTEITALSLDIGDAAAVEAFVTESLAGERPLKGVIHGAAVIKDGLANQLTPDMITDALTPKVKGAWNLHRALARAGAELDFLVGFSSIAQVVGSAGQCNYIAANAFLDALAHYRRTRGLAGSAIDWGVIADAGFVTRNAGLASYLESVGQFGLSAEDTDAAMEVALARDVPAFLYARADWEQVARANPALGASPRISGLLSKDSGSTTQVRARLMQLDGDDLIAAAEDFLKDEIISVLKIEKSEIQSERPMSELGLDSLSSFELKVRVETALSSSIPVSKFLQAPSISELAVMVASEVTAMKRNEAAAPRDGGTAAASGSDTSSKTHVLASNLQMGLRDDAISTLTSETARPAMEHVGHLVLETPAGIADLRRIARKLERRHAVLKARLDGTGQLRFDGRGITVAEGPDCGPLDVDGGEFARLSHDHPRLSLRLHAIAGDAASLDLLLSEIGGMIAGDALDKPMPRTAITRVLQSCRYDAEDAQAQTDRAFFWYGLTARAAEPVPFRGRSRAMLPPAVGRNHGPAGILEATSPGGTGNAHLMMQFATALRHVTQSSGPVVMGYRRSLRPMLQDAPAVGPFEIEQPFLVPDDASDPVQTAQFLRLLDHAPDHLRFDSHAAARDFGAYFARTGTSPFQVLFEPVAALSGTPPQAALHDVLLQARTGPDRTELRLVYDRDVVAEDIARAILRQFDLVAKEPELVT